MKTTIKQSTTAFQPIDVTIRIESVEELKQFLLLTSVMTDANAYDAKILEEIPVDLCGDAPNECANSDLLANFVEQMISVKQWIDLQQIYEAHIN